MRPFGSLNMKAVKLTAAVTYDIASLGPRMWFRAAQRAYCGADRGKFVRAVLAYAREAKPGVIAGTAIGLTTGLAGNIVGVTTPVGAVLVTMGAIVLTNYAMAKFAHYFRPEKLAPVPCQPGSKWFKFYPKAESLRNGPK